MNYQLHMSRIYFLNFLAVFNLRDGVLRGIYYDRFCIQNKKVNLEAIQNVYWRSSIMMLFGNF